MARFRELSGRLGLGLLGLALPLVFLPLAEDAYRLPQLILLSLAVFCLCLSWARSPRWSWPAIFGAAFFAWRLATHVLAGAQAEWMLEQGLYALVFFWGLAHLGDARLAARFKAAVVCGAALAALYAFLQSYGWDPLASTQAEAGFGARAHASLGNPDFWGGYLILALPFAVEFPWLAAWLAAALVLTQTRAAWLGFGAGALLLAWRGPRRKACLMLGAAALAFVLSSFPNPLNPFALNSAGRLASALPWREGKSDARLALAQAAFSVALKHPLAGCGAGHFGEAFLEEQGRFMNDGKHAPWPYRVTADAHNDWLQLAAESGLAALLLFALIVFTALRAAWMKRNWMLAALLVSFGVNALLHFPMAVVPSAALVWTALGWALAGAEPASVTQSCRLFALLPLAAAFFFMRQLQASVLLNRGMGLSLAGSAAAADPLLSASARLRPDDARVWMRLGLNAEARGDLAAAAAAFLHCQGTPEGLANLSLARAKMGSLSQAREDSLKALALNPNSLEALGNLGKIEYLLGHVSPAETAYLRGLEIDPLWAQGHFNLAALYLNSGRKSLALPHLREALRLDPQNTEAARLLR